MEIYTLLRPLGTSPNLGEELREKTAQFLTWGKELREKTAPFLT